MPLATATLRTPAATLRREGARAVRMSRPNEDAFLEAFDAYADALFRHACLRLGSRERARDLTQDAFIKAWDYLVNGHEVREWRSFLYRVANNLIIDEYRRAKDLSLDTLLEEDRIDGAILAAPGGLREREDALDEALTLERVRTLMNELPEPYRGALVLRYVDGLSPREVGEALAISENAAAVRIHRAVGRLRELCREHRILP